MIDRNLNKTSKAGVGEKFSCIKLNVKAKQQKGVKANLYVKNRLVIKPIKR